MVINSEAFWVPYDRHRKNKAVLFFEFASSQRRPTTTTTMASTAPRPQGLTALARPAAGPDQQTTERAERPWWSRRGIRSCPVKTLPLRSRPRLRYVDAPGSSRPCQYRTRRVSMTTDNSPTAQSADQLVSRGFTERPFTIGPVVAVPAIVRYVPLSAVLGHGNRLLCKRWA